MELESVGPGREELVFRVCNALLKAQISGDLAAIEKAEKAYDLLAEKK